MKNLEWHEPIAYCRAKFYEQERANPWSSLRFAGAAFLIMLGLRLFVQFGPDAHPPPWPPSIALAVGVAVFAAYGLPAVMSLLPGSIVILSDKGVNNNVMAGHGWSIRFWPWENIAHALISVEDVAGKRCRLLTLIGHDGSALVSLAMPDYLDAAEIEARLTQYGLRLQGTRL